MSSAGIRSGRAHVSSAKGMTSEIRRFREVCVVIRWGANRSRSIQRNQSIVFVSLPP